MTRRVSILVVAVLAGCTKQPEAVVEQPGTASAASVGVGNSTSPVEDFVRELLVEQLAVDRSKIDMNRPVGDAPLKADDLDLVEMVMEIEEHFDVSIPDEEMARISGGQPIDLPHRITPDHLATLTKQALERAGKRPK